MAQLTEHDKPIQDAVEREQSPEEKDDIKLVLSLYGQGKKARGEFDKDWKKRDDYYLDKIWPLNGLADRSKPTMPLIYTTIQTKLPLLTDSKPGINVLPPEPQDYELASMLSQIVDGWWENPENTMDFTLDECLLDSMKKDAGVAKITWDMDKAEGQGDVRADRVDPFDIYVPYGAKDFDKNCPWVIHEMRRSVGELRRKFPKMAEFIKPDEEKEDKPESMSMDVTLVSPIDRRSPADGQNPAGGDDDRKTATVLECWLDDDSIEEYFEENDQGEKVKKYKKKYPRGKLITALKNKKVVLQSIENPYSHGKKPFVRFIDQVREGEFWGMGEAEPLMSLTYSTSKMLQNIFDYTAKMGNPVWKTEAGNGVTPDQLTNATGQIIQTDEGKIDTIKRDIPPPMGGEARQVYETLMRAAEIVSGSSDITQGRKPMGVTAAAAIEGLQEASHTRIRKQERNMNVSIGQLGFQVVALMMQYYRGHRVAKITGKSGWPEYFEFFFEDTEDGLSASKRTSRFEPEGKTYIPEDNFTQLPPTKGIFDVKVMSGTSLPFAKTQKANTSFKLFELGIIDAEEVLKSVDWPNTEEVMNRMRQQAQAQAQMQGGQNAV